MLIFNRFSKYFSTANRLSTTLGSIFEFLDVGFGIKQRFWRWNWNFISSLMWKFNRTYCAYIMFIYSKDDFINVHLLFRYSIGRYQNGTRSLILHLPLRLRRSGDFSGCKFKILRSQPHTRLEIKKSWKKLLSLFF